MTDVGAFVNAKLNLSVPWNDLVASGNLQKVIVEIVKRLDRQEQIITSDKSKANAASNLSVVPTGDMDELRKRLDVLENVTLQQRVDTLDKSNPLKNVVDKSKAAFSLSKHVLPLTQIKGRLESCETGLVVTGSQVDDINQRIVTIAQVLETKASREELQTLEAKHKALDEKVEKLQNKIDQLIAGIEKKIAAVQERVDAHDVKITR
jgi:hypothetical protein